MSRKMTYARVLLLEFLDEQLGNVDQTGHLWSAQYTEKEGRRTIGRKHDINVLIGDVCGSAGIDHNETTAYLQSVLVLGPYQRC